MPWSHCKLYYEIAKQIKFPKDDILFVHNDIYEHKLLFEYSIFAYHIGKNIYNEMTILMNSDTIQFITYLIIINFIVHI